MEMMFLLLSNKYGINMNTENETLKLPICPKCHDTKSVKGMLMPVLLIVRDIYPWYECANCEIKWNVREGIRSKDDQRPCFS